MTEKILGIDKDVFEQHFRHISQGKPQSGQILAKYTAVAEFVEGQEKRDIIMFLKIDKAFQAAQMMRKMFYAKEPDCYRVLRQMCEDLIAGMSDEQVEHKPYPFILEIFFYAERQYIPADDPHWETINLVQYDPEKNQYSAKIEV
jgi:hypothetical protein